MILVSSYFIIENFNTKFDEIIAVMSAPLRSKTKAWK